PGHRVRGKAVAERKVRGRVPQVLRDGATAQGRAPTLLRVLHHPEAAPVAALPDAGRGLCRQVSPARRKPQGGEEERPKEGKKRQGPRALGWNPLFWSRQWGPLHLSDNSSYHNVRFLSTLAFKFGAFSELRFGINASHDSDLL